jgi:sialic acid synthase SpsE
MSKIILDFGSGNTCRNDWTYAKKMIDKLKEIDTGKHEVIIKWQLFEKAGKNILLKHEVFERAYNYAKELGYQTTSSVFDKESLDFLLQFDIPFVKIANNRKLDWLIGEIPRKIPAYISYGEYEEESLSDLRKMGGIVPFCCVSQYPANFEDYAKIIENWFLGINFLGISDHTTNFGLWYRYQPKIIEMHYKLSDSTGLDAGLFARTPEMLKEVL